MHSPNDINTTFFPPYFSHKIPVGIDVIAYPQKYEPNKRLCSNAVHGYRGPYFGTNRNYALINIWLQKNNAFTYVR